MRTTRLAAILFAELDGFAAFLAADEKAALAVLARYRAIAESVVEEHEGEIVDATGEELLVVFESAVSAVQCALHLGLAVRAKAEGMPPAARFTVRCGVHLGEIWRDESRVYGNGVNVAARVKQAAASGAILISEDVERQISNKLDLELCEIPAIAMKNIERPLKLFEIVRGAPAAGPAEAVELAVAKKALREAVEKVAVVARETARREVDHELRRADHERHRADHERRGATVNAVVRDGVGPASSGRRRVRSSGPKPRPSAAARLEKAHETRASGIKQTLFGLAAGGASLWLYLQHGGFWYGAGIFALGLLPFASGMKKLLLSGMDIKDARRATRRAAGREGGGDRA
jgi:class 3 adenylate cyclase